MKKDRSQNSPPESLEIKAEDYPALRSFLRGYFHQDMKDEYGSPGDAVREFCGDASAEERGAVAKEWAKFLDGTRGMSLDALNKILTQVLGSSYRLTDENVREISSVLSRAERKR